MLSAKPWKSDALIRLLLGVFACVYAGSLALSAIQFAHHGPRTNFKFFALCISALCCLGASLWLLRKPWRLEDFLRRVVGLLVTFYLGLFLGAWAQMLAGPPNPSIHQMVVAALSFQGAALLLVACFVREHGLSWKEAFGLNHQWRQAVLLGCIVACLFLPIGRLLQIESGHAIEWAGRQLPKLQLKPEEQQAVLTLETAVSWGARLALGAITILLAPVAEEVLFRGILYPWLKQAGFPRLALWGTALLFAAIHLNLMTFLPLALLALALTVLYERTDNLLAPITAHALFNAFNFTLLYILQEQLIRNR